MNTVKFSTTHTNTFTEERSDDLVQYYQARETDITKVVSSVLLVVGTVGNVMSVLVLFRRNMRRSNAAIYLMALAVVDLSVGFTGLLRMWTMAFFSLDFRHQSEASCRVHKWLVYSMLDTSVWVLVALTLERLASVCLPHQVKNHCNKMTSFTTIGVVIVVMLSVNSHYFYTVGCSYHSEEGGRVLLHKCETLPGYKFFIDGVWPYIDMCVYSLIPLVIVTVSNSTILLKMTRGQVHRKYSQRPSVTFKMVEGHEPDQGEGYCLKFIQLSSMTAMLLTLNGVLLFTTVPISLFYVVWPSPGEDPVDRAKFNFFESVFLLIMYTSHAVNFLLYCSSGSRFRKELRAMYKGFFRGGRCRLQTDHAPTRTGGSQRRDTAAEKGITTLVASPATSVYSLSPRSEPWDCAPSTLLACCRCKPIASPVLSRQGSARPDTPQIEDRVNAASTDQNTKDEGLKNEVNTEGDAQIRATKRNNCSNMGDSSDADNSLNLSGSKCSTNASDSDLLEGKLCEGHYRATNAVSFSGGIGPGPEG